MGIKLFNILRELYNRYPLHIDQHFNSFSSCKWLLLEKQESRQNLLRRKQANVPLTPQSGSLQAQMTITVFGNINLIDLSNESAMNHTANARQTSPV